MNPVKSVPQAPPLLSLLPGNLLSDYRGQSENPADIDPESLKCRISQKIVKLEGFFLQQDRWQWTGQGTGADGNSRLKLDGTHPPWLPPSLANPSPLRQAALLAGVAWAFIILNFISFWNDSS